MRSVQCLPHFDGFISWPDFNKDCEYRFENVHWSLDHCWGQTWRPWLSLPQSPPVASSSAGRVRALWAPPRSMIDCWWVQCSCCGMNAGSGCVQLYTPSSDFYILCPLLWCSLSLNTDDYLTVSCPQHLEQPHLCTHCRTTRRFTLRLAKKNILQYCCHQYQRHWLSS